MVAASIKLSDPGGHLLLKAPNGVHAQAKLASKTFQCIILFTGNGQIGNVKSAFDGKFDTVEDGKCGD
jgi:hypothetical protein